MTGIHKSMFYPAFHTRKKHPFKPPVRIKYQIFIFRSGAGKHIAEIIVLKQIGLYPAELAGKESVCFFKDNRRPALRALMFD
jgi:hypothetical protein